MPRAMKSIDDILAEIALLPEEARAELLQRLAKPPVATRRTTAARPVARGKEWLPDFLLVFDGGSRGNPGPGYGSYVLIRKYDGERRLKRLRLGSRMTSNEAEYETLISALQGLLEWLEQVKAAAERTTVEIRGDSLLVVSQVTGVWQGRNDRMRALRDQVRTLLSRFGGYRLLHHSRDESVALFGH
jgi:ribonuclease HI